MANRSKAWIAIGALAAVAVVARLPQLLSSNLLLEGDECILGIMGMHVARGHDFPIFFYGQKYGLAVVEASAAAVSFLLFGAGPASLKIAILAVWIAGAAFYFRAFARVLGTTKSFLVTLLLVLMPAWAVTSMKAWSGYVTAFAATGLVIDLLTRRDERATTWLAAGAASVVVYFAQPLWLPGLLPIVLYHLGTSRGLQSWTMYALGGIVPLVAVTAFTHYGLTGTTDVWIGPAIINHELMASARGVLEQIYVGLTGSYYFGGAVEPGRVTAATSAFWAALLVVLLARQINRLVTGRHLAWAYLLAASIVLTVGSNWILLDPRDARYVLPMHVPLVFLAGVELFDFVERRRISLRRAAALMLLCAAVEGAAMREFAGYTFMWWHNTAGSPSESKTLHGVIDYLKTRGVTRVYSMNGLLQWNIAFYSRESVLARWTRRDDRVPAYVAAVDDALAAGRPVAIVGYIGYTYGLERLVPDPRDITDFDGKYYVYLNPDRELLGRVGFH